MGPAEMSRLSDRLGAVRLKEQDFPSLLLFAIAAFTTIMLLWAAIARLDVTITAPGRLIPASQLQILSNLEGGTLAEIRVRPGQRVKKGDLLVRLDPVLRASDAAAGQASLDALNARAQRLSAAATGQAPGLDTPDLKAIDPTIRASEQALARTEASALAGERSMALARAEQARRAVGEAEANLSQRREALRLAEREEAVIRPLVQQGAEPALSLDRASSQRAQAQSALRAAEAALNRARAALVEAQRGVTAVDLKFRTRAAEELANTQAELAARNEQQPALADRLARTEVRAPMAGVISRLKVTTAGSAVAPGEPLVEMVPAGDKLLVEARVSPADIGFVQPGQKARVRITAYDYGIYGALDGTVQAVAPDAVVDERSGEVHFLVRVALNNACFPTKSGRCLPLGAGMLAEANLLGPKRSVLSYLLSPITQISDSAFREK
jgi:adhesin transport system membrane fusion protein